MKPNSATSPVCRDDVWMFWLIIALVIGLTIAYWYAVEHYVPRNARPTETALEGKPVPSVSELQGQFGDMFGGLNALFSGMAFAGVIYALLLQRKDLQLQHHALLLQQHSLLKSAEMNEAHVRLAAETVALQALVAQIDQWQKMLSDPDASMGTREKLAAATAALIDRLATRREQLERRLASLNRDEGA